MAECLKAVEQLLLTSNRPHNVQTVINNTGSKFTKGVIEKSLTALVDQKKAIYQEVGKSGKLYYWNQSLISVLSDEAQQQLTQENVNLQKKIGDLNEQVVLLKQQIDHYNAQLSDDQYRQEIRKYVENIEKTKVQLDFYKDKPMITETDFSKLKTKLSKAFKTYNVRRNVVKEFTNNLSEGMEKKVKDVNEMIGIDEVQNNYSSLKKEYDQLGK